MSARVIVSTDLMVKERIKSYQGGQTLKLDEMSRFPKLISVARNLVELENWFRSTDLESFVLTYNAVVIRRPQFLEYWFTRDRSLRALSKRYGDKEFARAISIASGCRFDGFGSTAAEKASHVNSLIFASDERAALTRPVIIPLLDSSILADVRLGELRQQVHRSEAGLWLGV